MTDLATVLATSTNRAYGRRLSILLERGDSPGVRQLRRERLRWLLPALGLFRYRAHALALCGMYCSFAWLARRELRRTSAG